MSGLHVVQTGNSENPVMLFLHGFLGSAHDWDAIAEELSGAYYSLAVDLPGHGESLCAEPKAYTMEATAQAIIIMLDECCVKTCVLVGYSMGGRLALFLALRYPERFHTAVIASASPGLRTAHECTARRAHDEALADELLQVDFDVFLQRWYAQPLFQHFRNHPSFPKVYERRLINGRSNPQGLALSLRQMGTGVQSSLWEELRQLSVSTMFIVGEYDEKFTQLAQEMQTCCPAGLAIDIAIMRRVGHVVYEEDTEGFVALLHGLNL